MPSNLDLKDTLSFIESTASEQGAILMRCWNTIGPVKYKDRRDFATDLDLEVEKNIRKRIRARFPAHGLSGEETDDEGSDSEYLWVIDPIDGTKYYARQGSLFSVSIGLLRDHEPVLGVVYHASSQQCFSAYKGGGATLNGQKIIGPNVNGVSEMIINVDTSNSNRLTVDERKWFESHLLLLTRNVYRIRSLGIASLTACWVATGALDGYVDLSGYTQLHDLAAGLVIMSEANCKVDFVDVGLGPPRLLAASHDQWPELKELLFAEKIKRGK